MTVRIPFVAAALCTAAIIASGRSATAQSPRSTMLQKGSATVPQNVNVEELPAGQMPSGEMPAGEMPTGELPAGQMGPDGQPQEYYPSGPGDASFAPHDYHLGGCADGSCAGACCDRGYCAPTGCPEPCCDSSGGWCSGGGQFYITADYLNVRATFSQATAFVHEDIGTGTTEYVPLEFNYESSYRIGGGYRLCCCGEQIRFMYTRMTSESGTEHAFFGDIVPYETNPSPNGGETFIHGNVDAKSFDLEWAKTIPLGGQCCDECTSPCGDGRQSGSCNTCCKRCPAWDITWSGGVRIADVEWSRTFERHDPNDFVDKIARPEMDFNGAGLRTGLEGRRYFFKDGWLSIYAKGDISLLLGDVSVTSTEEVFDPTTPQNPPITTRQKFETTQIIPVTELEAGVTAQVSCHAAFTAGYLLSAWHDLGFRDESSNLIVPGTVVFQPPTFYDDANILGFDGFFARLEVSY